ncbi:unnamed protein product [Polarella glacialis]|uniref:Beta-galactosidase n=1 Tax=Polarella glacialis TaxID=89957 RepID=A0A813FMR0_POLGL|nr:unnamed protein product [Polarella glacialis]
MDLRLYGVRDFALVFCDGQPLGIWDRNSEPMLVLPPGTSQLDILVEVTARVNFGPHVSERKGLVGSVRLGIRQQDEREVFGWESTALPMRSEDLARLPWQRRGQGQAGGAGPCFYRGTFSLSDEEEPADTWLHLPGFTRGFVALNGFNLGWHRQEGPQLSLYAPAALLRRGAQNEIVVFELLATAQAPGAGGVAPAALLEEAPRWSCNRTAAVTSQLRETWDFARQVGLRRLCKLAIEELGTKKLLSGAVAALVAAGTVAAVLTRG